MHGDGNGYSWVEFFDIFTLPIIHRKKNLDIHKLSIRFRISNEYLLFSIIY
jgi:hypothetical protein